MQIIDKVKSLIKRVKEIPEDKQSIKELTRKNRELMTQLSFTKDMLGDPIEVVRKLTGDDFKWFNYEELSVQDRNAYHSEAQTILRSNVFKNEISKLNTEFLEWAGKQSRDFQGVRDMRHQISGINLLVERLGDIQNVDIRAEVVDEPYSAI